MMTTREYLLTVLGEEGAEVAQGAAKALRFGESEVMTGQPLDNMQRLFQEVDDLNAVASLLGYIPDPKAQRAKAHKVRHYMQYSAELGIVERASTEQVGI